MATKRAMRPAEFKAVQQPGGTFSILDPQQRFKASVTDQAAARQYAIEHGVKIVFKLRETQR
jgi:hypothetical protein